MISILRLLLTTVYVKISHFNKQTHPWETCTFQMKTSLLNALFAFGSLTYAAENRDLAPQHKIVQPYTINVDFSDCGACCQAGCGFSGAIRFFNNPPPDVADTQTGTDCIQEWSTQQLVHHYPVLLFYSSAPYQRGSRCPCLWFTLSGEWEQTPFDRSKERGCN